MDKKLIGLTGPAGCGKDTIARELKEHHHYHMFAFADPLKEGISTMLDIPINDFYDRELKERLNEYWKKSPRELAQTCGTEWARVYVADDVWIRRLAKNELFAACERRVIVDARFGNEASWIRNQGGIIWHINRSAIQNVRPHISESGIRFRSGDIYFDNNDSLARCKESVRRALI
jgi:hypothetical protein